MVTPNCQECGACCADLQSQEIDATGYTGPSGYLGSNGGISADETGRCVALLGEIGSSVSCAVYDDRPKVCREFPPGSVSCYDARDEEGLLDERDKSGRNEQFVEADQSLGKLIDLCEGLLVRGRG